MAKTEEVEGPLVMLAGEQTKHAKLIKSIINPDNPFSKMTDKDMLIFNPNYHQFLAKLKNKDSKTSELSRIMSQPFKPTQSKVSEYRKQQLIR